MKKFLVVVMILCCLFSCGHAEIDISGMSENELLSLQRQIAVELAPCAQGGTVVWENEYVRVTYMKAANNEWMDGFNAVFIVENLSDKAYSIYTENASANRWVIDTMGVGDVLPNTNLRGEVTTWDNLKDYLIEDITDINNFSFNFYLVDEKFSRFATSDPITLNFSN